MNPFIQQAIKEAEAKLAKWSRKKPYSMPLEEIVANYCTNLVWEGLKDELSKRFGTSDMQEAILQDGFAEWLLAQDMYIGTAAFCKASPYTKAKDFWGRLQKEFKFFDTLFFKAMWSAQVSRSV